MADYGGTISLSQAHTSDESSSEHSPPVNLSTTPNTSGSRAAATKSKSNKLSIFDPTAPETASRKPRGRPPGSKNKPKPPVVITREPSESSMKPVVLEIAAGSDIIETIISFAKRNHSGVSVVSANGNVSNVTLRHPISHAPALSLHGPFGLLSLTGSFLGSTPGQSTAAPFGSCFSVTLAGGQGQVFGGIVGGKVTAATTVVVVAGMFASPTVHRLPMAAEENDETEQHESKPKVRVGGGGGGGANESASSAGMSMGSYVVVSPNPISCQVPPDVMPWGPTARPY